MIWYKCSLVSDVKIHKLIDQMWWPFLLLLRFQKTNVVSSCPFKVCTNFHTSLMQTHIWAVTAELKSSQSHCLLLKFKQSNETLPVRRNHAVKYYQKLYTKIAELIFNFHHLLWDLIHFLCSGLLPALMDTQQHSALSTIHVSVARTSTRVRSYTSPHAASCYCTWHTRPARALGCHRALHFDRLL